MDSELLMKDMQHPAICHAQNRLFFMSLQQWLFPICRGECLCASCEWRGCAHQLCHAREGQITAHKPRTQLCMPAAAQHVQIHIGNLSAFQQNRSGKSVMLTYTITIKGFITRGKYFVHSFPSSHFKCIKSFRLVAGCKEQQRSPPKGTQLWLRTRRGQTSPQCYGHG